jgi:serine protease Do
MAVALCIALGASLSARCVLAHGSAAEPSAVEDPLASRLGLKLHLQPAEHRNGTEMTAALWIDEVSGASARAGVEVGDVLIAINGHPVHSVAQVQGLVAKAKRSIALLIERDARQVFIAIRL